MTDRHMPAIDCGTQSLRAMVFSVRGDLLAKSVISYAPCMRPVPGCAEQDPETCWCSLAAACRHLKNTVPRLIGSGDKMTITLVGKRVLTHFYPECDALDMAARGKKTFDGPVVLARDLLQL